MTYATLISAAQLDVRRRQPDCVIFDCRFNLMAPDQGREQYAEGHVPGAHYANLDNDLSSPPYPGSGRHPLPDPAALCAWLGARGVTPATQVVACDAQGGAIAARLWWLLRWLGHWQAAVLDGGLAAWRRAGLPEDALLPEPPGTGAYPGQPDDGLLVSAEALGESLAADTITLLDARSAERFRGEAEPIDPVAGHVPGAGNHPFTEDLDTDGLFKPAVTLRERFERDIAPRDVADTVCMCGSGVTACHTLLAMECAGLHGARLYAGSWSEWIANPSRPIARGDD